MLLSLTVRWFSRKKAVFRQSWSNHWDMEINNNKRGEEEEEEEEEEEDEEEKASLLSTVL